MTTTYKARPDRKAQGFWFENEFDGRTCQIVGTYRASPHYVEIKIDGRYYTVERSEVGA